MGIKVGILGLAGAGKDTFATLLQQYLTDFTIDRYAAPLKELTAKVYGCTLEELEDRVFKERPQQVNRDDMLHSVYHCLDRVLLFTDAELDKASELYFEHLGSASAISPREFQQRVGTDVVRAVKPAAWVDYLQNKDANLIVADVRFENELCDYNILVMRAVGVPKPTHTSEHLAWDLEYDVGLDLPPCMSLLDNDVDTTLEDLERAAKQHAHSIRKL
jgi:hypothetical protein